MAKKRSKRMMAGNIKKHFSASGIRMSPEKIAEQNARAIDQIGNVMIMLKDILAGQEGMFAEMIDILSILPETTAGRQKQAELVTKKTIDAIIKIEKQLEKETDPDKKKKLQGAIDVLKTQGVSAYSMARPQRLPSTFSEMLQNAIFGVTPGRKESAGGFLPALGQVAKDKVNLAKMIFGIFPKQKSSPEGFEGLLETTRKRTAKQEKLEEASSVFERILKGAEKKSPSEKKKVVATVTSQETLDFYDNVLEGLNLVVMNQNETNKLLADLTPSNSDSDSKTTSINLSNAQSIPDVPATPADDLISRYGERTLLTPAGSYALNNEDDVIAGTNLFPKGSVRAGGMLATGNNSGSQLLSMRDRTDADDIARLAIASSPNNPVSTTVDRGGGSPVINNIDNSTVVTGSGGGGGGSTSVVYIRDVHNSHVRFQQKRLTSLLA